ncbi:MAG: PIG-L family deacetylase [Flavobacteriaceae bacterium]
MKKHIFTLLIVLILPFFVVAQLPVKPNSGDIHTAIKKLNFLGSVLYLAAHPDDENTRLINYLSNEVYANTAYLAMTRGDGGQNLIGKEIREGLGVIRTQELLAARRIDGAHQFFTRANDFGYSKNPTETFNIWGKQNVLNDVVWVIRNFKPDVIIDRFNVESAGKTHGHHTASAILSVEAFDKAADASMFPKQLKKVATWQTKRLFFNTSWYFYGSREKFKQADKTNLYNVDVGVFYPLKGRSNNELAAEARTMHKSQGFGSTGVRGSSVEYLEWLKGSKPSDKHNIFDGINTTWTRVKNGKPIGDLVSEVDAEFDFVHPEKSLPNLIKIHKLISNLPDSYWKKLKLKEVTKIIQACAGLYLEATVSNFFVTQNSNINIKIEAINRSRVSVVLRTIGIKGEKALQNPNQELTFNKDFNFKQHYTIPDQAPYSTAYWLNKKSSLGLYDVQNKNLIGLAETPPAITLKYIVSVNGYSLEMFNDVVYKKKDPVRGEVYRRFEITPPVFANIAEDVYIFSDVKPNNITVKVKAGKANLKGTLKLGLKQGWQVAPSSIPFDIAKKGSEKEFTFKVTPPQNEKVISVKPIVTLQNGKNYSNSYQDISYNHIPAQLLIGAKYSKFVRLPIKRKGQNIAYIMGAGDAIPSSLKQIGYNVMILKNDAITAKNLAHFDAVIVGVRAYNTNENLKYKQAILHNYVANGGTIIAQYNTSFRLKVPNISPYKLTLSHDRVTLEDAKVTVLNPKSGVLNYPNKITQKDFDGWVQERGLYFPNKWDAHFKPILSMHDPGETPKKGSLLIAKYKKGYFIYTGLSFFRELPAGVPGAYKLFTNLISIGKNKKEQSIKN